MPDSHPTNHPYPQSGHLIHPQSPTSSGNGRLSFATPSRPRTSCDSFALEERDNPSNGNRSTAPTLNTTAETTHSDTGQSKAATTTTRGGALSSRDGTGGVDSTFSSPNQSQRSLSTTLTTIHSTSVGNALNGPSAGHANLGNTNAVVFSHQYPVSPAASTTGGATPSTASAIPRHIAESMPHTYFSATNHGLLTDNASVLTLASSSKRRRRSMDTDASVRALAPSSVWGGSRESLPLSVLSGHTSVTAGTTEAGVGLHTTSHSRPSIGGLASAERASVYSSSGVAAPALASERNSLYSKPATKDLADAKSLHSITNIDARSLGGERERGGGGDVSSLRTYESTSARGSGIGPGVSHSTAAPTHGRNGSVTSSVNLNGSPSMVTSSVARHASLSGALTRRGSDWADSDSQKNTPSESNKNEAGGGGANARPQSTNGKGNVA